MNREGELEWSEEKLYGSRILAIFEKVYPRFHYGLVYSDSLAKLIYEMSSDAELKLAVFAIRKVEDRVRNIAAHQMVSISDEKIRQMTRLNIGKQNEIGYAKRLGIPEKLIPKNGLSCDDIMKHIRVLFRESGIAVSSQHWNSYEAMNQEIIQALHQSL